MTTKWWKQPSWTEFSPPLLNFTRWILSFMHQCNMNVHVILINKTTCLVSGNWHVIFGICLSRDSYLIFMNSHQCALTRCREQRKNPKLIHFLQQSSADQKQQSQVIIACIKLPYGSGHTDENRWWMTTMNANLLWRVAIHDEFLYVYPQKSNESIPIWETCQSHAYSSWIQGLINGVGVQLKRKWRK